MSGRVITITSGKGGVGKTTVTGNLAVALAQLGKQTLCIDLDIGLRNLDLVLGLENRVVYDVIDVVEGRVRLRQALVRHKQLDRLHLMPAAQWRDKTAITENQAKKLCQDLRKDFELVLIDSPAGIEHGFKTAIAPADQVLIVTTPEVSAIRDADRVIDLLEEGEGPKPQLILNRVRPAMVKRGDMLPVADVLELLNVELIGLIPEDPAVIANTNIGTPVVFSPRSEAGPAFTRIARRLLNESVPFPTEEPAHRLGRFSNPFRS